MTNSEVARVLIADDEESIRIVLRETLEEEGCEVTDVDNGSDALDALTAEDFQLAFLDIRMPGLTGLELLDRVRAAQIQTAIVIMTAQNTFDNAVEAMRHGALEYLVKPFGMAEVNPLKPSSLFVTGPPALFVHASMVHRSSSAGDLSVNRGATGDRRRQVHASPRKRR